MAEKIVAIYQTSKTLYAIIVDAEGSAWNGSAFESPVIANWATYAITLTEASTTGIYRGDFPALDAGVYGVAVYVQAGGSPSPSSDGAPIASRVVQWDGSAETFVPTNPLLDDDSRLDNLDAKISTRATLTAGSISWTRAVDDGTNPLDGVDVWITTDEAGENIVARSYTDASGQVTFMLDAGDYYLWKQLGGYTFTNPEEITVSA
jgi:hypothetical protein